MLKRNLQPPTWLKGEAVKEWKRITQELNKRSLLEKVDTAALSAYCLAYAHMVGASSILDEEGLTSRSASGTLVEHPAGKVLDKAMKHIKAFSEQFGLTPRTRHKLDITTDADEQNKFDAFLKGEE